MVRSRSLVFALFMIFLGGFAVVADAEVRFGLRAGEYTDVSEPFLGAEIITPIGGRWYFNPNIELVFVDDGDLATFNADFHYDFKTGTRTLVWAGGGLAVVYENFVESETDLGGNVIGGVGWNVGEVLPYVQVKALLGDRDDFVVMGGIRF